MSTLRDEGERLIANGVTTKHEIRRAVLAAA